MRSLSTGKLSSLYSLPMCMVFERVRSIKKRIREGKHIRDMVIGRYGIVFFCCFLFSRWGGLPRLLLENDSPVGVVCGLENSVEMTDGNGILVGRLVVGRCPMEGPITEIELLGKEHDSQNEEPLAHDIDVFCNDV
ncbi:hypothetical protein LY78DRAFT_18291 [Colletotrichum sublineola]|nr:hypothetical protein LY78DRAFT_18291 [Colletotrichum sublineola]